MKYQIGIIGLGVMGQNLALNIEEKGFSIVGFDRDLNKIAALREKAASSQVSAESNLKAFVEALQLPRSILILVPAGEAVDAVLSELTPFLSAGDIIIDSGNSHFKDTVRREESLRSQKISFIGMGISGGEAGARKGPSLMPGGDPSLFKTLQPLLEAISAKRDNTPCVAHLGFGGSGHFVKMVHNGIEYAIMQLIAESYDLMKRGLGMTSSEIHSVFSAWEDSENSSFLVQITRDIFLKPDADGKTALVECISDCARQKGTGKWTVDAALDLQVPIPTIDVSVSLRNLSRFQQERQELQEFFLKHSILSEEKKSFLKMLQEAFHAAMILTFDQGMHLIQQASIAYHFETPMEKVAQVWRAGCIIRAAVLSDIEKAYRANPRLNHLILDGSIAKNLKEKMGSLRKVIQKATSAEIPVAALMASLSYFDSIKSAQLPTNLIQAQRDYFGAHKYERIDQPGVFHHTEWA